MAVRTHEEILALISERLTGTDDSTLELVGDLTDTFADYETRISKAADERKQLDDSWRARYRERFFHGTSTPTQNTEPFPKEPDDNPAESITIDDLFTEKETK